MARLTTVGQNSAMSLVAAVALGVVLAPLNSTMLAVALSPIKEDFHVSTASAAWLIATYLIVMAVGQPIAGRLGDLFGRRRLFMLGLFYFAGASALAVVSWDLPSLIFFRANQAIGGALFMPNGLAILRSSLPQESRGRAFGFLGAAIAASVGVGPPLGGVLTDAFGWRALFVVNVPIALIAWGASVKYFPKDIRESSRHAFDFVGAAALAVGLFALIVASNILGKEGPDHPLFGSMLFIAVAAGALFLWWESRHKSPIISLSMFRRRSYAAGAATVFLSHVGIYTLIIVVPLFFQELKGESVTRSGIALVPIALFTILLAPLSGFVADKIGRNLPAAAGAVVLTGGAITVATWDLSSSLLYILFSLGLYGIGQGVMQTPNQTAAIEACPADMAGAASGTYATARYLGAIVATGLIGIFLTEGELASLDVFRNLSIVLVVASALAVVTTMNLHRWVETPGAAGKRMPRHAGWPPSS